MVDEEALLAEVERTQAAYCASLRLRAVECAPIAAAEEVRFEALAVLTERADGEAEAMYLKAQDAVQAALARAGSAGLACVKARRAWLAAKKAKWG